MRQVVGVERWQDSLPRIRRKAVEWPTFALVT